MRLQQLTLFVGDAEDHRRSGIEGEVHPRPIGVSDGIEQQRVAVEVCSHRSHAILHGSGLVKVIGIPIGKGQCLVARTSDRRDPV